MDVIADLANPLPVIVIGDMLSLPPQEREQFKRWSDNIIAFGARLGADKPGLAERALRSTSELTDYFRALVAKLRRQPNDTLLSALVAAEEQGDRLTEEELLANAVLLLMNGHETTTYMIGNGLLALLRHPDQRRRLQDEPTLIGPAVEELLRYDGSVQMRGVTAAEDLYIGDNRIGKGQSVLLLLGAANRDPARFTDPDPLDLGRRENGHLDFGRGIHFCIGAALAHRAPDRHQHRSAADARAPADERDGGVADCAAHLPRPEGAAGGFLTSRCGTSSAKIGQVMRRHWATASDLSWSAHSCTDPRNPLPVGRW
jgi:pimeloyl-[acyl-carrier protein] synthase